MVDEGTTRGDQELMTEGVVGVPIAAPGEPNLRDVMGDVNPEE